MSLKQKSKSIGSLTPRWKPRNYQTKCVEEGVTKKRLALFLDPGLGKTSILLQIFNKLSIRKQAKGALIIAPLNPCYMTWPQEIKGWTNFRRLEYVILHGRDRNVKVKQRADIFIINPEGIAWLFEYLKKLPKAKWPFDTLIVDESSKFGSLSSKRTKQLWKLVPAFKNRFIANGTPVANGFNRLMPQMFIIDRGKALGTTAAHYMHTYFEQYGNPKWRMYRLQKGSDKRIMKKIADKCVRLSAEDHVEMPERILVTRLIDLPEKAEKAYKEIETELFTLIDNNELVAESASSLATKLHQLCNGTIYEDQEPLAKPLPSHKRKSIVVHAEKLIALDELVEEFNGKPVLIAYKFTHDKTALKEYFKKRIKFFDDAKSGTAKAKLQKDWNDNKIPMLAGNPQSIGHGLNLQKGGACVIIFYSIDHDYEIHDQFIRRLLRSGNPSKHIYLCYVLAKDKYDHQIIYPNLLQKQTTQDSFLKALARYRKRKIEK